MYLSQYATVIFKTTTSCHFQDIKMFNSSVVSPVALHLHRSPSHSYMHLHFYLIAVTDTSIQEDIHRHLSSLSHFWHLYLCILYVSSSHKTKCRYTEGGKGGWSQPLLRITLKFMSLCIDGKTMDTDATLGCGNQMEMEIFNCFLTF